MFQTVVNYIRQKCINLYLNELKRGVIRIIAVIKLLMSINCNKTARQMLQKHQLFK